jgi:hypothetical protein
MMGRAVRWLTESKHSTYGLAVTRMLVGFVIASQLVVNWADRAYTWGSGSDWAEPVASTKAWPSYLGLYDQLGPLGFDIGYVATIVFATLMMLGYRTRASSFVTLVLWMSLYVANPFVGSGGDAVLRMVLLYLCLTDAGLRWSLDARAGRHARRFLPDFASATVHNIALILIVHQVVVVYVASALWKVQSDVWLNGTAVYYPLQTQAYSPWSDVLSPIITNATIVSASTYAALVIQLFFPVMLLYRPTRAAALVLVTGMHAGIGILMGILYFSLVMIAVDMILVSDATWRELQARTMGIRSRRISRMVSNGPEISEI